MPGQGAPQGVPQGAPQGAGYPPPQQQYTPVPGPPAAPPPASPAPGPADDTGADDAAQLREQVASLQAALSRANQEAAKRRRAASQQPAQQPAQQADDGGISELRDMMRALIEREQRRSEADARRGAVDALTAAGVPVTGAARVAGMIDTGPDAPPVAEQIAQLRAELPGLFGQQPPGAASGAAAPAARVLRTAGAGTPPSGEPMSVTERQVKQLFGG